MLYLNSADIEKLGICWGDLIAVIRESVIALSKSEFSQPLKPYLRFGDPKNRIIAMPAYVGGNISYAGIKWISSYPGNINRNVSRANSITILNDVNSGIPIGVINGALLSAIRTAAVTGFVIDEFMRKKKTVNGLNIGIIGFGPIGQTHLGMIEDLFANDFDTISIYDIRDLNIDDTHFKYPEKISFVNSWEECFQGKDIVLTCTVSDKPYIDCIPKKGSLQLNISLRDYLPQVARNIDFFLVDDWDEVCRENTDIERMYKAELISKADTTSLSELLLNNSFKNLKKDDVIMFNPMGMAVFDIAIASHFFELALSQKVGVLLQD
ncbi:2,3-diaminopropionate biosynthesis protein SbnB [Dyadobacter diqingensis]|uniref:2,3-diaminopropionate biosynthesis protein SbnB n=1 Tax=Dyadobacter diqingensis TaxID=2938121 RepID=UPI0020C29ACF|nr:2,3-diaminopropionate biosynthesis protein SbnB [Dyadobacter diqingensis]